MRLATYNVENLFLRARAMNLATLEEGREVIDRHARINRILAKETYDAEDRQKIVELLVGLGLEDADDGGSFARLRQNRGRLLKRPRAGEMEVVARGRGDWIGWVDLETEAVDAVATRATARVIKDLRADVLAVCEAESRLALVRFSEEMLPRVGGKPYAHVRLIDGNDDRGIDVGLMTKRSYEVTRMASHVDDAIAGERIFSRDCAEYVVRAPEGEEIVVLVNHFKSKASGGAEAAKRRRRQATRVAQIYWRLLQAGATRVAVVGDLNDVPKSVALRPLIERTDLRDASEHPDFDDGGRRGTYGGETASEKIDYLLLSPALFEAVREGGIFRMGAWGGVNGTLWPHYPEITRPAEAASDHAAVWVRLAV